MKTLNLLCEILLNICITKEFFSSIVLEETCIVNVLHDLINSKDKISYDLLELVIELSESLSSGKTSERQAEALIKVLKLGMRTVYSKL